jgi:hypothetical protein
VDEKEKFEIVAITQKVRPLIEQREYKKAVDILKSGFQQYPNQKEFATLYSEIKSKYKKEKIQKLQEQAIIFLRSGAEDKAQEIFREIYKLDPTRTDLKDSFRKTRKEVVQEYNKQVFKNELVSSCIKVCIVAFLIIVIISIIMWYGNKKHLDKSLTYISSGILYEARQELNKCGKLFAGRKTEVSHALQNEIEKLISQAKKEIEQKNFGEAKRLFSEACKGAKDDSSIREEIKKCEQLEQAWIQELAKQEQLKILSDKALAAKNDFELIFNSLNSNSETEVRSILETAKNKSREAENLFAQNEFEGAEKQWRLAADDCKKAEVIAQEIINKRNNILIYKSICDGIIERGKKINAHIVTNGIWGDGEKIANRAKQNFDDNKIDEAGQLWQQATKKFNEAIERTKQDPNYIKALTYTKKWNLLKQGFTEENIRAYLGKPKYIQTDSDKSTWYYQTIPAIIKNADGNYDSSFPNCGYIAFATMSVQVLIDRNNEAYYKQVDDENDLHEKTIEELNNKIKNERTSHSTYRQPSPQILNPTYSDKRVPPHVREQHIYYKNGTPGYDRHANQSEYLINAKQKENERHEQRLLKLAKENDAKIFDLTNGISPREPKYVVAEWKMPDAEYLACFMNADVNEEKGVKPDLKWQMPVKWRTLKLNIREQDASTLLGEPEEKINEVGRILYRYGKMGEYGILVFEICPDSINRLRYWKEPLWAYVKQEFQNENIAIESEKKEVKEPNGLKI